MKYLALAVLWIAWCAVHSGLISLTVTKWLKGRLGNLYRFHRLFFNAIAIATLIPVLLVSYSIQGPTLCHWEGPPVALQVLMLAIATMLAIAGAEHYDIFQCLGFRQIMTGESHGALTDTGKVDNTGVLGAVRHPWYLAAIMFIWAGHRSLTVPVLITNVVLTAYLIIGTLLEERKLLLEYGDEYRQYQAAVSMLLPVKWLQSRIGRSLPFLLRAQGRCREVELSLKHSEYRLMISRTVVYASTAIFGIAVILSGLYRFVMEPGGSAGLWFGLVMGALALLAAVVQRTRLALLGDLLAATVAVFVGGWFCFENFAKEKYEIRMYLMIVTSAIELAVLAATRLRHTPRTEQGDAS